MNVTLLNIVKRIAADHGEGILGDPQRLKAFFSDLAKEEPKPLRMAFGRCVEAGAYAALKTAPDAAERASRKAAIAQRLRDTQGLDISLCAEALDVLEAALYGTARSQAAHQQAAPGQQPNPVPVRPAPTVQAAYTPPLYTASPAKKHTLRNVLIVVVVLAAAAALITRTAPGLNISLSPWRGYPTFESFSRAMNIDKLEKPITEEDFTAAMSLAAFAYYLSGDKLADALAFTNLLLADQKVQLDNLEIIGGEKLTEQYGVSAALRRDNNYLLKRDIMKGAAQFAYFNGDAWVVLSVSAKQK
jgi:hypothetical protein